MLDKLLDIIILVWNSIVPVVIIKEYELGVRLRFGKLSHKILKPGLHLKIPLADYVLSDIITKDTLDIKEVNITTLDEKTITVGAVLEFNISDIIKHTIYTNTAKGNIHDICRGIIAHSLMDCSYQQCKDKKTLKNITKLVEKKCFEMGVTVLMLSFTDMTLSRVVKIFGINQKENGIN
ncbi:MAG: SPFH domain-containing protein [Bacteroidia bacterium]